MGAELPRVNLSAGDFACAMAHRNVYDRMMLNSLPCALVFENDIKLGEAQLGTIAWN